MQKNPSWYPWIFALLALGILTCIVLILCMLAHMPHASYYSGARLVKEVFSFARI